MRQKRRNSRPRVLRNAGSLQLLFATTHVVLDAALRHEVAFVSGDAFFPDPKSGSRYLRLNFSNASTQKIP
jgi:DNA-binding transcriptional MocR family regulator